MSYRESIHIFHPIDIDRYLQVLMLQFNAQPHPEELTAYQIDTPPLPFYRPQPFENYLSILGFNYIPLSSLLILVLIEHPELAPSTTVVRWVAEQEIITQGTLEDLARQFDETLKRTSH